MADTQLKFDPDGAIKETLKSFEEFVKDFEYIYEAKHAHRLPDSEKRGRRMSGSNRINGSNF